MKAFNELGQWDCHPATAGMTQCIEHARIDPWRSNLYFTIQGILNRIFFSKVEGNTYEY